MWRQHDRLWTCQVVQLGPKFDQDMKNMGYYSSDAIINYYFVGAQVYYICLAYSMSENNTLNSYYSFLLAEN